MLSHKRNRSTLARHDEWHGAAQYLAGHNDDLALAGLFLGGAAINAILFAIRLPDLAAEISAINRDDAGKLGLIRVLNFGADRLAENMG
jgi:hypothetical protein